jgi:hypothetical protein
VAPGVTLGAYRALSCRGVGITDIFIEAFMSAFDDGADIITTSLGGYSGWSEGKQRPDVQRGGSWLTFGFTAVRAVGDCDPENC